MTEEEKAAALKQILDCWKMHGGSVRGEEPKEEREPELKKEPTQPPVD